LSPILVRPVREQLEHDRVIRLLLAKYKRKFEVAINPGNEQNASVLVGTSPWYPDLVLYSQERGRRLAGTVEVETAESVNNLEAMSQWKTFAQQRAPFHLYVPASSIDTARRMATDFQIPVAEIWAYSAFGDQMRFALVHRSPAADVKPAVPRPAAPAEPKPRPGRPRRRRVRAAPTAVSVAPVPRRQHDLPAAPPPQRPRRREKPRLPRARRRRPLDDARPPRRRRHARRSANSPCLSSASFATNAGTKRRI
jgi:hypothetical protein